MPIDKAIDSTQLNANLTAVADAIRAKGETAEALAFPDGFVSAIGAIQTGHELNFTVVGGTTEPENPTENTIWVSTDQAITGWVFSHNLPDSPFEGMVWIVNGVSNAREFSAVSDVELRVQIAGAKQYISGAWALKTVLVYQNGAWVSTNLFLYHSGDECADVTGGWKSARYATDKTSVAGTVSKNSTHIKLSTNAQDVQAYPAYRIDLTDYRTLHVNVSSVYEEINWRYGIHVRSAIGTTTSASNAAYVNVNGAGEYTLDVSSLNGDYYICIGLWSVNSQYMTFDKVWLE